MMSNIDIALLNDHCQELTKKIDDIYRLVDMSTIDKIVIFLDYHKFNKEVKVNDVYFKYAGLKKRGAYSFVPCKEVIGVLGSGDDCSFKGVDINIDVFQKLYEEHNDKRILDFLKSKK